MKPVVIYSEKRVFDGFLKIDEAELSYRRFDGTMSPRLKRQCMERGDSVAAVLFHLERKTLLFTNQFKFPTWKKGPGWIVEAIAGMPDEGETPEEAIRRELLEETGYSVEKLEPIATFYVSPGGTSERIILFYAEVTTAEKTGAGGGVASEGEDIQTVEWNLDEARTRLARGEVLDAKTIIGIQWVLLKRSQQEVTS